MADTKTVKRNGPLTKSVFVILAPGTDKSAVVGVATNANDAIAKMEEVGSTSYKKFTFTPKPKGTKAAK